ncbi:hypothetical protein ID866_9280, partial [Astraeus odoratus]
LRAKVEESFNNLLKSLALAGRTREELKAHRAQNRAEREIDPLNALDCPPGTPQRFSELTDENFPLFITFDCLARLVAADLEHKDNPYVDEVQDLLITDALLLRILCRNPNGLLWAGDTAQTISAGSSFRFEDLKAFIYRAERDDRMRLQMARKKPMVFQLTTNYRSHSGIINCAQAVIDIISRFWPDAIDTLRPEQGRTYGPRPMFFIDWEEGMNSPEQFFSQMKEKQIELGAEQCILVRDNATRGFLKQQVGDDALILTPEESKGLEFNDIFLYNFFEDSAAEYSQWRLVLAECGDSKVSSAFERDEDQFALLCTELRVLYVGITRAINNLYLLDKSNKSKPMRTFWSSRDLIRCTPVEANISHYVAKSDPHEWVASGRKLFAAGRFKEAIRRFRRAGEPYRYELQRAALQLREDANRISPVSAACQTFLAAGEAFTACAEETLGVDVKVKLEYYNNAGDCYDRGGDVNRASASYILAKNFAAAARVYQHACHFNEIVQMFEQHYMDIAPHYNSTLFTVCRRHYGSKNIRPPKPLFPSIEEELDYLKRAGFDEARIDILEFHGRYIEAAEIHLHCGQPVKAIQSCLKAQQDETAFRFAVDIVLDSLWPWCSFVVLSTNKFSQKGTTSDILEIALNFPSERLSASECDQIRFFKALRHASEGEIYQLGCQFLRQGDDFWKYLMETTRLARLALAFGGRLMVFDAIRIAKSSPFYWIPSMRPTSSADRFIIESIVKGLDGAEDDCISHGVSALQYMLHKGVRMDLSTIYDYLEEICSTLVISSLFHLGECSLISQDLVVPRKWLVNPSKFKGNKDTSSTPAFFAAIQQLLDRLRSGKAQKWFTHAPNNASFIDITVTKLCRLLCIVGYNTCDPVTSEWIANILSFSLRAEIVESNPQGTINVIHRSEYLSAIWSFDKDTSSDDLVQLIHKERSDTTRPVSPHIALVVYDDVVNIPRIVCRSPDISILLATQGPYIEFTGAEYTDDTDEGCKWSYPTEEVTAACRI